MLSIIVCTHISRIFNFQLTCNKCISPAAVRLSERTNLHGSEIKADGMPYLMFNCFLSSLGKINK